jgi:hypothetical protein
LPAWLFEKEAEELTTYRLPEADGEPRRPLAAQTGLFADTLSVDSGPPGAVDEVLDFRFEPEGVTFLLFPVPDLYVEKYLAQSTGGLRARYVFDNRDEVAHHIRLVSRYELNPNYAAVLGQGRDVLAYYLHDDRWPAVRNTVTGLSLVLEPSLPWADLACTPALLALEVSLTFDVAVGPRSKSALEIKLGRPRAARPRRQRAAKTG